MACIRADKEVQMWFARRCGYDIRPESLERPRMSDVTVKLLNVDCKTAVLPSLGAKIGMVVVDPPYGLNKHSKRASVGEGWDVQAWTAEDLEKFLNNFRSQNLLANRSARVSIYCTTSTLQDNIQ